MAARAPFTLGVARDADHDAVTIAGVIDETSDLAPLARLGERAIVVDLRGVGAAVARTLVDRPTPDGASLQRDRVRIEHARQRVAQITVSGADLEALCDAAWSLGIGSLLPAL